MDRAPAPNPRCCQTREGNVRVDPLGAYAAAATLGKVQNPFVLAVDVETGWLGLVAIAVFICLDDWTINVLNLYSGGLSLSNMFERFGRFWTTLIVSVLGVALCSVSGVLNGYFQDMSLFGNVFAPVAGILVFDYLFVRNMRIDVAALYDPKGSYRYWFGFNPIAITWTAIGCLICTFVIPVSWLTALITGICYVLTIRMPEAILRIAKRKP
jgi:nucleobase:cation symporter-1, NCS1 family